jgi:two-component system chemotaxis response regulator CheB
MKEPTPSLQVLVVDDSAVARQVMSSLLTAEPTFHVSTASDPLVAMTKMKRSRPDVILLDLEMPRMDGITFLKQIMTADPIPVVVCSGVAGPGTKLALRALEAGAVDIVLKPKVSLGGVVEDHGLADIVRAAAQARVTPRRGFRPPTLAAVEPPRLRPSSRPISSRAAEMVVAMGASTGGTEALRDVLRAMPPDAPGIVIVQHMPQGFTAAFAEHLNAICQIDVQEARGGDRVRAGLALVAPGNRHLRVVRRGLHLVVDVSEDAPVSRHRPSVDVLFDSVAQAAGAQALGVIMTGMGNDGAHGLLQMKRAGATTIAQDESTSIVFGMPKEAIDLGAVDLVLPLPRIAYAIIARTTASSSQRLTGG